MSKKNTLKFSPQIKQLSFPEDEKLHSWLSDLLKAYYTADQGIYQAIKEEEAKGRKLACSKACSNCCLTHRSIPVYPIELVGISWYVREKISGELRKKLQKQLSDNKAGDPCVFLVDDICSIHPLRPMACRHFNVFSKPCEIGEDAYFTRKQDVLIPIRAYMDEAFFHMLPFYGVKKAGDRRKIIKKGLQHELAKELQSLRWSELARKMLNYDQENKNQTC